MRLLRWLIENSRWVLNTVGAFAVSHDFTANTVISSTQMNTNFGDIETAINDIDTYIGSGVITGTMLATISTAGKINGAAITGLASVPSGAGILPAANGGTEFDSGDICLSSAAKDEAGWTEVTSTYAGKYLRVGATGLATGGAATHTHAAGSYAGPSHTHSVANQAINGQGGTADPAQNNVVAHNHGGVTGSGGTGAVTGTSAAGVNTPLYVDMRLFSKD